ncbi:hypothetical protein ACEXQE_10455 [Herbiconiux sp. P17]|uniref:hypothetical protein n=1 Tax=Herbiconiux wuyangfengii TaxID=3342794 RepID=UPI0035B7F645
MSALGDLGADAGPVEVWASDSTLLSFDGRVLEVFGFADVHRFHRAFRPRMSVNKKMVSIRPTHGGQLSFFFDQDRRAALEEYAARLATEIGE